MRPVKLKMKAFGPYADTEIIDFNQLNGRNLFLITGPTGSGKTTIFDAISFAMYGEANGTERSVESLRSQFAEENILTEIELDFELRGVKYHIYRIPKQQKLKARGNGYTEQKPEATLTIYQEDDTKVISGVTNVNEKIEEIIGINYEQFRQIMMIPQGEFKKFLIADSQDREKVLQKLFDTSIFRDIQNKLDMQEKSLFNEIKSYIISRSGHIDRIKYGEGEELDNLIKTDDRNISEILIVTEELISKDNEKITKINEKIEEKEKYNNQLIEKIEVTKSNNKIIEDKSLLENKIREAENKISEIKLIEEKVNKAESTQLIVPLEQIYKQKKAELFRKENESIDVEKNLKSVFAEYNIAKEKHETESSSKAVEKSELCLSEITSLKNYEKKVEKIELLLSSVNSQQKSFNIIENNVNVNNLEIKEIENKIETIRETINQAKDDAIKLEKVNNEIIKIEEMINKLDNSINVINEIEEIRKIKENMDLDLKGIIKILDQDNEKYQNYKKNFFQNQAAILGQDLIEGEACPVCGSKHHPQLAQISDIIPTEVELNRLEGNYKKTQQDLNDVNNLLSKHEERLLQKEEEYQKCVQDLSNIIKLDITYDREEITMIESKSRDLKEKKSSLIMEKQKLVNIDKKINQYEADISTFSEQLLKKKKIKEELEDKYLDVNRKLVEAKSNLDGIYNDVPEEYREVIKLRKTIQDKEELYQKMKNTYDEAIKKYQEKKEELAVLKSRAKQLEEDLINKKHDYQETKSEFDSRIIEEGFINVSEYLDFKLDIESIKKLKKEINDYYNDMNLLKKQYDELSIKTEGLFIVEIAEIEEEVDVNRLKKHSLLDQKNEISNRTVNNSEVIENINEINKLICEKEEKYRTIGYLAKVAKGDNKARMTFERYVLAAFLEDIIIAANIRLRKMTNGRYILSRTEELERKNKQSGLELEVYDNYTGKSRHVKTLSGGESFKASLSMALGLSDVVQSYAGGVRLDTMFIDEGFGSLDSESLDNAILTLIDLQKSGRLVGIISHVPELKERIDAKLEVTATNTGSKTEFVVI